jgi:hypothetical protein
MKHPCLIAAFVAAVLLSTATAARAATPIVGPISATNIQGVSVVLQGTVDPGGLPTTYHFEYVDQKTFTASGFSTAASTPAGAVGPAAGEHPATGSAAGLHHDTFYRYRLVATNFSGTAATPSESFKTTHGFGFLPGTEGFAVNAINEAGKPVSQAGTHPYELSLKVGLNVGGEFEHQPGIVFPDGDVRDLHIEAPPGLIVNPLAVPRCGLTSFHTPRVSPYEESRSEESCPPVTQVGTVDVQTSLDGGQTRRFGAFTLVPPEGVAAQVGFAPYGSPVVFDMKLRRTADSGYVLALEASNIPQGLDIRGLTMTLWGTPWSPSHDRERGDCLNEANPEKSWSEEGCVGAVNPGEGAAEEEEEECEKKQGEEKEKCEKEAEEKEEPPNIPRAYLTLPHVCTGPLLFEATADSWQEPAEVPVTALNRNSKGQEADMNSCLGVDFDPRPSGELNQTKASSPSGFNFRLNVNEEKFLRPGFPAPAPVKRVVVLLPEGVTINPSVGAGLTSCAPGQYVAETAFSNPGDGCPNSSKLGDFIVDSLLFKEFFKGGIYVGEQSDAVTGPSGLEFPLYLVARIRSRGVLVKATGTIVLDPGTGRITAVFDELPQLPYTNLNLTFRTGQRSLMVTPPACGPATTTIASTSWLKAVRVETTSVSLIKTGQGGGPCPDPSDPAPPFSPKIVAGGVNSNVNSFTPYFVHISREDTEQELTYYSLVLPRGITGKLAGIPFCPDAGIEAARHRSGFAEAASPSCPAASQVGHTESGYGAGETLAYSSGRVYLAGPYHGAPLSLVTINSATTGPYDLGTIVIRSAFQVDPHTAQLRIDSSASDPIPHILNGVPLHLRDVRIYMDRHQFTHSPSSCAASELESTLGGTGKRFDDRSDDTTATGTSYFQLLNCLTLHFEPQLGLRLRGGTKRRAYPQLRASFIARGPGDSNLKEISVTVPQQEFLAQEHIEGICGKAQFNADNCPADSIYGSAVAYTPLLDDPLRGNVYLRANPEHAIPDLVASLNSGAVRIILEGRIGPGRKGGIEAFFSELPDQPLSRFVMTLYGGKRGLLQNSADICATPPVASVRALAQNNIGAVFKTKLRGRCKNKNVP